MEINLTLTLTFTCLMSVIHTALSQLCHEGGGCTCKELAAKCSSISITTFPSDLPPNITELIITGANIRILRNIPNYQNLTTLRITHSHIRYIQGGAFRSLPSLTHLVLSDNELSAVWEDTFDGLKSLKFLSLEQNPIHVIPNGTFKGEKNPELEFLKLSYCQIYKIESNAFFKLINLRELLIDNNKLHSVTNIGNIIGDVQMLETFDISGNLIIQIIGDPFAQLSHLRTLHLHHNHINYISRIAFSGLVKLKNLYLQNNEIRTFPQDLFSGITTLDDLDLSYNKLRTLSPDYLPGKLTKLHVHHNEWRCDCNLAWMLTSPAVKNKNLEVQDFVCKEPKSLKNKAILNLTHDDLCSSHHNQGQIKISVVLGVVLTILCGGVVLYIACIIYRKRQRRRRQQSLPYSQVNRDTELFGV